jgi:hypothetical protein
MFTYFGILFIFPSDSLLYVVDGENHVYPYSRLLVDRHCKVWLSWLVTDRKSCKILLIWSGYFAVIWCPATFICTSHKPRVFSEIIKEFLVCTLKSTVPFRISVGMLARIFL